MDGEMVVIIDTGLTEILRALWHQHYPAMPRPMDDVVRQTLSYDAPTELAMAFMTLNDFHFHAFRKQFDQINILGMALAINSLITWYSYGSHPLPVILNYGNLLIAHCRLSTMVQGDSTHSSPSEEYQDYQELSSSPLPLPKLWKLTDLHDTHFEELKGSVVKILDGKHVGQTLIMRAWHGATVKMENIQTHESLFVATPTKVDVLRWSSKTSTPISLPKDSPISAVTADMTTDAPAMDHSNGDYQWSLHQESDREDYGD